MCFFMCEVFKENSKKKRYEMTPISIGLFIKSQKITLLETLPFCERMDLPFEEEDSSASFNACIS